MWEQKLLDCQKNHVPRKEYDEKVGTLKTDISEIKGTLGKIGDRLNDLPTIIKALFDSDGK